MPRLTHIIAQDLKLALHEYFDEGAPEQNPNKKRLLFLHGLMDTARSFDALAAELQDAFFCSALSFRGHGESERAGAGASYHVMDHAKDLACVFNALETQKRMPDVVVAHSMGAIIAVVVAGTTPYLNQERTLFCADALGGLPEAPEEQPERFASLFKSVLRKKPFAPVDNLDDATERIRMLNPNLSKEGALRMVQHAMVEKEGKLHFSFDARLRGPTPVRYPEAFGVALYDRVQCKVHVLRAEHGYIPDNAIVDARVKALRAEVTQVPGAYHHIHVDNVDAVAKAVLQHTR